MDFLLYFLGWGLIWLSTFIGIGRAVWSWGPGGYRLGMAIWKGVVSWLITLAVGAVLVAWSAGSMMLNDIEKSRVEQVERN